MLLQYISIKNPYAFCFKTVYAFEHLIDELLVLITNATSFDLCCAYVLHLCSAVTVCVNIERLNYKRVLGDRGCYILLLLVVVVILFLQCNVF